MRTRSELRQDGSVIWFDSDVLQPMEPRLFDPDWLQSNGHHRGTSLGRNQAHFFSFAGYEMVLRQFQRGGLVGRVNRDLYLQTGHEKSRSLREFELLYWMREQGLPVPRPIAAKVDDQGLFYRAAIITERIPEARPAEELLRETPLPQELWREIGAVIRRMHDLHVFHSDLNCRNILLTPDEKVWLIDFDKGERRDTGNWTRANLDRLKRSLTKQKAKPCGFNWQEEDWSQLLAGYEGAGDKSDGAAPRA